MKNFNYGGSIKPPTLFQKIKIRMELWVVRWLYRLGIKKTKKVTANEILGRPFVTQRVKLPSVTIEEANQVLKDVLRTPVVAQKAKITGIIKGEDEDGSLIIEDTDQEVSKIEDIISYLNEK